MPDRFVLLGSNIAHSRSPALLNHLFHRFQLPFHYELLECAPEEIGELLRRFPEEGIVGANVTSPHKERVISHLSGLSGSARAIGAANTIVRRNGRFIGANTDVAGVVATLRGDPLLERSFRAAVLGTGGAARAVAHALLRYDTLQSLTFHSRDRLRAEYIAAADADPRVRGTTYDRFPAADLVVNATPVGLPGNHGVLIPADALRGCALFFDLVYAVRVTAQMEEARSSGARAINGEVMFLTQAAASFRLWTGITIRRSDLPISPFISGTTR